jgi:tetratricopeptide (TPR) repeat protein
MLDMQLPPQVEREVEDLSEQGNELFDRSEFDLAIEAWKRALLVLPSPQAEWEAAMWLYASIGDAHFQCRRFEFAIDALHEALCGPEGNSNPFVLFRLGQAYLQLGDNVKATEFLLRAYMLDGQDIFDADPDGADSLALLEAQELIKVV